MAEAEWTADLTELERGRITELLERNRELVAQNAELQQRYDEVAGLLAKTKAEREMVIAATFNPPEQELTTRLVDFALDQAEDRLIPLPADPQEDEV